MKNKILFVLCLLSGLMFINSGFNKFFWYMPMPEEMPEQAMKMFTAMQAISWLMPLLAAFEILGGLLFIIPRVRALGAVILTPIIIGIVAHHAVSDGALILPLVMLAIHIWVVIENKEKYLPMIR